MSESGLKRRIKSMGDGSIRRRRFLQGGAAALLVAGPSMVNIGRFQVFADTPRKYSARAVKLVERSLVIDMLAVLKLDFTPEAFAVPTTEQETAMFRACGITGLHNSIGIGGPTAYEDALTFLAAWQGYAGRHADLFSFGGRATDLDHAKADNRKR